MCRWVAGMIGRREQRLELGIELEWSDRPVGVLGIPAGHRRVIVGDALQRIDTRRPRRVVAEPIFPDLVGGLGIPEPVTACAPGGILPEEGVRIALWRAHKVLD